MINLPRRKSCVEKSEPCTRQEVRDHRTYSANSLGRITSSNTSPDEHRVLLNKTRFGFLLLFQPSQSQVYSAPMIWTAGLVKLKKAHWSHRILMHGIHRIALDHGTLPHIIMPPPLPFRPLKPHDLIGALRRNFQRDCISRCRIIARQGLNRVDLICKTPDVRSIPGRSIGGSPVSE